MTLHVSPYLLFAGTDYYAGPGWDCFRGAYLTQEDASRAVHEQRIPRRTHRDFDYGDGEPERFSEEIRWYQIVSLFTLGVVEHGGRCYAANERPDPRDFKGYTLEAPEQP